MSEPAKKKAVKKAATKKAAPKVVECIALRAVGLDDRTCKIGEEISLPVEAARKLQDAGAIKVKI